MKINFFDINKKTITYIICIILSILFVVCFSYSTSPLYPYYYGGDTAQFLTIGKGWYLGKIPYRDMFDHKGPIIFFLDMLGFFIARGSKFGICIIQSIFMIATVISIYKISQIEKNNNIYGVIAVIISLIAMKVNYVEGNTVEEFCLPFICWSIYGIIIYLRNRNFEQHSVLWTFFYGITAAICFLTRATNFIILISGIIIICCFLIKNKVYNNLLYNALTFILGFLIIFIPFSIYFGFQGCFIEFLNGTIFYNIEYAKGKESWLINANRNDIINFSYTYFVYYIVFFVSFLKFIKKDYLFALFYLLTGLLETYLFMSGSNYAQYPLICIVQIVIFLNEVITLDDKNLDEIKLISFSFLLILFTFLGTALKNDISLAIDYRNNFKVHNEREWESLVLEIPDTEKDSFVAYGGNEFKELYLLMDLMPKYKYFVIQEWHSYFSDDVKENIYEVYDNGDALWILSDGSNQPINKILNDKYYIYDKKGNYILYRRLNDEEYNISSTISDIYDIKSYLDTLNKLDDISIFISIKDIPGEFLNKDIIDKLKSLGFQKCELLLDKNYHSYIGIINSRVLEFEEVGDNNAISKDMEINGARLIIESQTLNSGNTSKIIYNNVDLSKNQRGINIVVINNKTKHEIDSVAFDTHDKEIKCYR